ncbi:MAG TPA: VOC family protein [Chitinophagaceae bacterium]
MLTINPYLNFMGNTEAAFNFYRSVFGGEFLVFQRFRDVPGGEKMSPADQEKIMHVGLKIGNHNVLMGTDALESMGQSLTSGNNFYLSLSPESEAEADVIFGKLAEGGNVTMPLDRAFWGAYFGMVTDKFGIQWMVNYDLNSRAN